MMACLTLSATPLTDQKGYNIKMNTKPKEPIADTSHPIWRDIEKVKKKIGRKAWLDFLLDKKR